MAGISATCAVILADLMNIARALLLTTDWKGRLLTRLSRLSLQLPALYLRLIHNFT